MCLCLCSKRFFSDYYFLADNKMPVKPDEVARTKSSRQLHDRAVEQIRAFEQCVADRVVELRDSAAEVTVLGAAAQSATTSSPGMGGEGGEGGASIIVSAVRAPIESDWEEGGLGWFRAAQM